MEKWPYLNVPVYVVCPRDGEGHSWTLHRNYLPPINSNLEQGKKDEPMVGVGNDTSPPQAPSVGNAPAESGPSGIVTSNSADNTPQGSPDWPAPLRCGTQTTRNQLPWRYQNFGLLANTGPTGIWDAWVDLCICLCIMICLYTILGDVQCRTHFTGNTIFLPSMTHFSIQGNSLDTNPVVDSRAGKGVYQRTFCPIATPLPEYK